jgi:hypothetical protein
MLVSMAADSDLQVIGRVSARRRHCRVASRDLTVLCTDVASGRLWNAAVLGVRRG